MTKGEVGYRLIVWNQEMRIEKQANATESYAHLNHLRLALESQIKTQSKEAGLRLIIQILKRSIKGEIGMRVSIWSLSWRDDRDALAMRVLERGLEAKACASMTGSGLRVLMQTMARRMKGELGYRVETWHQRVRMAQQEALTELNRRVEGQLGATRREGGLRLLIRCWQSLTRGEIGMRLSMWKMEWQDERRETCLHRLQSSLTAKASDQSKGCGVRQMALCLVRMAKGESAVRIKRWQQRLWMDQQSSVLSLKEQLDVHMLSHCHSHAIQLMAQFIAREVTRESGLRLMIWRMAWEKDSRNNAVQMIHDSLQSQAASERKGAGVRQMLICLIRWTRGVMAYRLRLWLQGMWVDTAIEWADQYAMSATNAADLEDYSKTTACRLVAQIMARHLRGERGLRVSVWRQRIKWDTAATSTGIQGALVAMMRSERKKIALLNLRRALLAITTGEVVSSIQSWLHRTREEELMRREGLFAQAIKYLQNIHEDEMSKLEEIHVAKLKARAVFVMGGSGRLRAVVDEFATRGCTQG